jgi:hypothetical protein
MERIIEDQDSFLKTDPVLPMVGYILGRVPLELLTGHTLM